MIRMIISGGQTGADLAALDAAQANNILYGGWCPKGRINEKGKIGKEYSSLREVSGDFKNDKENYDTRTRWNIKDSEATLILVPKTPLPTHIKDGTLLTIDEVKKQNKPYLVIDLSQSQQKNEEILTGWIKEQNINILNIAGPRESSSPGIYQLSRNLLDAVLPSFIYSLRARL